ncbi:MAG TPA: PQQ-dependent sugar dehydrogenase [Gemmataceae bacterium]|nr:PQQ-dependent sugar dehydrogenase [Gemmataceae bacterium]
MNRFRPSLTRLDDRIAPTVLPTGFSEFVLAGGLTAPTGMAVAPDGRLFVTEQAGSLRVVRDGALLPTPFVSLITDPTGERGLLGVALDPNFAQNQFVYVYYTVPAAAGRAPFNRVSRFTASGDAAVAGSETVLLELEPLSATNHNGGAIRFGPDGKLYVAVGENAIGVNSQTLTNRLGKVLRINPDGTIPADNPTAFAGIPGTPQGANRAIWAAGLRNPFSFAFQPGTGRMFVHDVGQLSFEEVNEGGAGRNYGWPATEGDFDPAAFPNFTRPLYAYPRFGDPLFRGTAITGGTFYNPATLSFPAEFVGDYFFTDLTGGWIDRIDLDAGRVTNFASDLTGDFPVALAVEADGDLLYLARGFGAGQGAIYRIAFAGGVGPGESLIAAGPGAGGAAVVTVFDAVTGEARARLPAFDPAFTGGVRVATADVTGDQVADVIVGAGPGGGPHVRVFDGATGQVVREFFFFEPTFTGGVYVAAADFDRDGLADVAASADVGGGPRVRVLSGRTGETIADFFALETTFTGGTRVASGDVNADGVPDLVVSAGFLGGPRVAVFDGASVAANTPARVGADFFAYEDTLRNGAFVSAADFDNDGFADILTGAGPGGGPRVTVFSGREFLAGRQTRLADFFAGDTALRGGVTVAAADANGDGVPELVAAPVGGAGRVTAYRVTDAAVVREFDAFPGFPGAVFVG